jgi:N-acetylmuramoyl-L-alanine amidase
MKRIFILCISILILCLAFAQNGPAAGNSDSVQNARGERTLKAQQYLQQLGYNPGPADGKYGKRTESAIKNFQQDHGLPVTGMIGDQILKEMKTLLDSRSTPKREIADVGEHKQESPGRSDR